MLFPLLSADPAVGSTGKIGATRFAHYLLHDSEELYPEHAGLCTKCREAGNVGPLMDPALPWAIAMARFPGNMETANRPVFMSWDASGPAGTAQQAHATAVGHKGGSRHMLGHGIRGVVNPGELANRDLAGLHPLLNPKIGGGKVPHSPEPKPSAHADGRSGVREDLQVHLDAEVREG